METAPKMTSTMVTPEMDNTPFIPVTKACLHHQNGSSSPTSRCQSKTQDQKGALFSFSASSPAYHDVQPHC